MSERTDRPRQVAGCVALTAVAMSLAGALWWSGTLAAPERLLAKSYETAIADAEAGVGGQAKLMPAAMTDPAEQQAENAIWPSDSAAQGLAFHRPLSIGDRITIASREGKADRLLVVGLQQIDGAGIGVPGVRFQLVTSRQDGSPSDSHLVRFLIAVDGGRPVQTSNKTL